MKRIHSRLFCAVWLAVAAIVGAARADSAPPASAQLSTLSAELAKAPAVRASGTFGIRVLKDVRLDATGIVAAGWGPGGRVQPALLVSKDVMPPERPGPIAWSDLSRIETGYKSTGRFATVGMAVGAVLGTAAWMTIPFGYDGGQGSAVAVIGLPALTGLGFGALLGSQHYHWHTVYAR